jgi:hypothetical protein
MAGMAGARVEQRRARVARLAESLPEVEISGEPQFLVKLDPAQFYGPAYLGSKGWVAVRLDLKRVDWGHVSKLLTAAYRLTAPKQLAGRVAETDA